MTWGNSIFPLLIITPSGGFTGLFLYSPGPGPGNLIGSWTAQAGTDPFGNTYPAGINVTAGVLSDVVVSSLQETISPGPLIIDAAGDLTVQVFTTPGSNNWTAPAGVTSVQAFVQGPGGTGGAGIAAGFGGGGGGGGEFAFEGAVAVTPATVYHPFVGTTGTASTFAGDSLTVTANSGSNGTAGTVSAAGSGGAGGTGSTNTVHFNGGTGGTAGTAGNSGGGGGGGGASNSQAGNAGQNGPHSGAGGPGGATAPGQYPGGAGGAGGVHATGTGVNGSQFGGAGGGGGDGGAHAGGAGAQGRVVLVYSTLSLHTFLVAAAAAGTDPATGFNYSTGLTIIDPVFGDQVRIAGANFFLGGGSQFQFNNGPVDVITAGKGLMVKEGANCKQGTATLAAGTVVVANTSVTASSRIVLTAQDNNSTGALRVSARTAGTSFTITSSNAADTGVVAYEIFEPG